MGLLILENVLVTIAGWAKLDDAIFHFLLLTVEWVYEIQIIKVVFFQKRYFKR